MKNYCIQALYTAHGWNPKVYLHVKAREWFLHDGTRFGSYMEALLALESIEPKLLTQVKDIEIVEW